ncbi:MAG: MOSC domain-containing protein, partial [Actinomycetota bacterium]
LEVDFYGRPVPARVLQRDFGDAFSAFVGQPLRLVRAEADGDGPDVRTLSLVSLASVRELAAQGGHDGDLDAGRFRINVELDGCAPFEEDTWDGERVRIGQAVVRLYGQIPRCAVTTLSPDTGEKDFETLKVIAGFRPLMDRDGAGGRGIPFGMYAEVEQPGTVAAGDPAGPA